MSLKKLGSQFLKIRINDNDITDGSIGVMGDANARSFKITILAENNEVLSDSSVSVKLLIRQDEELILSNGIYNNNGTYSIDIPDEVFTKEQIIECQILVERENERLCSTIFKRKIERGLIGTTRDGKAISVDLLKVMEFGDSYNEKMEALRVLSDEKTTTFNSNFTEKLEEYNDNATSKEEILSNIKNEVNIISDGVKVIQSDITNKKNNFDSRYTDIAHIIASEESRVIAENMRQQHDKEIQALLMGVGYSKSEIDNLLANKVNHDEFEKYYTKEESDSNYALSNHTHTGYASTNHTHSNYALSNHTHDNYALKDNANKVTESTGNFMITLNDSYYLVFDKVTQNSYIWDRAASQAITPSRYAQLKVVYESSGYSIHLDNYYKLRFMTSGQIALEHIPTNTRKAVNNA